MRNHELARLQSRLNEITAALAQHEQTLAALRAERRELARRLFEAGCTITQIAQSTDLTPQRVSIILSSPHRKRGRPPAL